MTLTDALFDHLTAAPGVAALIGGRCYRFTLPQEPTLPALTYFRVDTVPEYSHDGDSNLDHPRFQVSCWAESQSVSEALARQVRLAMRGWRVAYGQPAFFAGQHDVSQPETGIYQVVCDYIIWWKEPL